MNIKLVIDGKEIQLAHRGQHQGYERFTAPKEISGLVATVLVRPNWSPDKKRITSNSYEQQSVRAF